MNIQSYQSDKINHYKWLPTFSLIKQSMSEFHKGIFNIVKNDDLIKNLAKNWKAYFIDELLLGYLCSNDDYDISIELNYTSISELYDFTFISGVIFKIKKLFNNMIFYCHIMIPNPSTIDLSNISQILLDIENYYLFGEFIEDIGVTIN
jgi:hypothetical protein